MTDKKFVENRKILENGLRLLGDGLIMQTNNREKSKEGYGLMLDAHLSVIGVIGNVLYHKQLCPGKTNESISGRMCLLVSFIHGIDICESSISQGLYVQAAALLKQEMETIGAINEYTKERRIDGRTPNISNVDWGLNRLYDELNKLAHVANRHVLNPLFQTEVNEKVKPVSITPIYDKLISRRLFGMHIALLIQLARCLETLHKDMYEETFTENEYVLLNGAHMRLIDEGWLVEEEKFVDNPEWPVPKS